MALSPRPRPWGEPRRFLGLILTLGVILECVAAPSVRTDALEDLLRIEVQQEHLPGVAVAVVRDGRIVRSASVGWADLELGVPAKPETVFQIQSITKTFTAAAVLVLIDEGKLSLDDPVSRYLEGTPPAWKPITIRHLLTHTSGIKDFINDPTASLRIEVTEDQVLEAAASRPLIFTPGERWAYSNTNYHLLAMIIRKLTGKWYAEFLRERIFVPLGMTNTRPVSLSEIIPNRASGYFWTGTGYRKGEFIAESILSYGGGGILSTAPDMARWAQAMMASPAEAILTPKATAQAWTPVRLTSGTTADYGLGWGLARVGGHREANHAGGHATGFSSFLGVYPDDHLAVVVLVNRGGANASRVAHRVAGLYIPELAAQPGRPIEDSDAQTSLQLRARTTAAGASAPVE
jgi:D-alanyl-D-alanine carboxypeptidase